VLEAEEVKGVCPYDSNPNDAHSNRMQSKKRFSYLQRCLPEETIAVPVSVLLCVGKADAVHKSERAISLILNCNWT